ncbi:DUF1684 domain-containing protein [Nocardioides oleivorans]|uniref:DUF1684 domain-containing protein n=1 Tax=Nocardioides oleivorans TaxID=273676 RepID=A0A4Q2RW41_9ACTN|nr:DUF1684 domain-containing protein [Nocardioides oleivorans]
MVPTTSSALTLVDWRARVSSLHEAVRAHDDPAEGHRLWREGRADLFATHPQSPIADHPDLRERGVDYWPYDPALRFTLEIEPADPDERDVDGGDDGSVTMRRVGVLRLPEPVGGSLDVWWLHQYGGGIFVPMRDGTAGDGSYGAGRYLLDTAKGAWLGGDDRHVVLDLNFAFHPSCRYDDRWRCPLAPAGNTVEARVEAGERL